MMRPIGSWCRGIWKLKNANWGLWYSRGKFWGIRNRKLLSCLRIWMMSKRTHILMRCWMSRKLFWLIDRTKSLSNKGRSMHRCKRPQILINTNIWSRSPNLRWWCQNFHCYHYIWLFLGKFYLIRNSWITNRSTTKKMYKWKLILTTQLRTSILLRGKSWSISRSWQGTSSLINRLMPTCSLISYRTQLVEKLLVLGLD